jgi:hypothetical protein
MRAERSTFSDIYVYLNYDELVAFENSPLHAPLELRGSTAIPIPPGFTAKECSVSLCLAKEQLEDALVVTSAPAEAPFNEVTHYEIKVDREAYEFLLKNGVIEIRQRDWPSQVMIYCWNCTHQHV